jgi:hypothetical protein
MGAAFEIPKKGGGGPTLDQAEEKDLVYWLERKRRDLPESRYPDRDKAWIEAAEAELQARGVDPGDAAPPPRPTPRPQDGATNGAPNGAPRATSPRPRVQLPDASSFSDPAALVELLNKIEQDYNLVGAIAIGEMPLGHSVLMTVVRVGEREWFKTDQGVALSGNALTRIADAAGVSIIGSVQSQYDPRGLSSFDVMIARQELSGSIRSMSAMGQIDMRPGTKEYEGYVEAGEARLEKARAEKWKSLPDPLGQIKMKLKHLPALAQTKAYLQAVRKLLSLNKSFTDAEAKKPFVVLKLAFTGKTDDPALRRMFARGLMQAALGGTAMLYGRQTSPQLAAPQQPVGLLSGGPIIESFDDDSEYEPSGSTARTSSGRHPYDDIDDYPDDDDLAQAPTTTEQTGKL